MEDKIIAYKGMDSNMQCRGMQYEVGKEFSVDGKIECCGNDLHACERTRAAVRKKRLCIAWSCGV